MTGQRVGYKRVSTIDQNTARQFDGLSLDRIFEDKASGKDTLRPQLQVDGPDLFAISVPKLQAIIHRFRG